MPAESRSIPPILGVETTNGTTVSLGQPELLQRQEYTVFAATHGTEATAGMVDLPTLNGVYRPRSLQKKNKKASQQDREFEVYTAYRRLCDQVLSELARTPDYMDGETLADEGLEIVAEVELLLEKLYDCGWGEGESLKRIVVAVKAQVFNATWDGRHLELLDGVLRFLRGRYLIDDLAVESCLAIVDETGLDEFRGTVADTKGRKTYHLITDEN